MVLPVSLAVGFAILFIVLVSVMLALVVALLRSRHSSHLKDLNQQITEIHQRVEEWHKNAATQQQVGEVQRQVGAADSALAQVRENLRGVSDFLQQTLHRETSDGLTRTLTDITKAQERINALGESLNDYKTTDGQQKDALADQIRIASERLMGAQTVLDEVRKSQRDDLGQGLGQALQALGQVKEALQNLSDHARAEGIEENHRHDELQTALRETSEKLASMGAAFQTGLDEIRRMAAVEQTIDGIATEVNSLTSVLLGRASWRAAELLADEVLQALPDGWIQRNVALGTGTVEFAIPLPGGYVVPLDSKFIGAELLIEGEVNEDRREEIERQLADRARHRAADFAKYVTDPRAFGFGIAAVPDAAYAFVRRSIPEIARRQVVVVPYSLLLPYVLGMYLLAQKLGVTVRRETLEHELSQVVTVIGQAATSLTKMGRWVTAVANSRDAAIQHVTDAHRRLVLLAGQDITLPPVTVVDENGPQEAALLAEPPVLEVLPVGGAIENEVDQPPSNS